MPIKKAVIPAAGFGTRFLPATKTQPKEMLPIVDKPAIHFVVEEVLRSGIRDLLIVTGRGKRSIEDYFDKNVELEKHLMAIGKTELLKEVEDLSDLAEVHYIRQKEQMGLGHAIYCARNHIADEPFAVLLGDTIVENRIPCTKQLVDLHGRLKSSIVAVEEVPEENIEKYGIFGGEMIDGKTMDVEIMIEKPKPSKAPSNLGAIGRYVLTPEIFDALEQTKPGVNGEIQLTDALRILLKTQKVYAHKFDGIRYDIGDKLDYLRATVEFALRRKDVGPRFKEYLKGVVG
jgi:UTP--glucose-1-phosphate uridylyltransferase